MGNRAGQDSFLTMEQWHWLTDIPIDELEEQYNTHLQVADYNSKFLPRRKVS